MQQSEIEPLVSTLMAAGLIVLGTFFLMWECRVWRRYGAQADLPADRDHFRRRYRRRLVGSALLVACGLAVFVGSNLLEPKRWPRLTAWFWIGVMLLLLWLLAVAAADVLAIRRYANRHWRLLVRQRSAMINRQLARVRAKGNGRQSDDADTANGPQ